MADAVCCTVIVTVCLAIGLPRHRIGIDVSDEGFLAYGAVQVMNGQMPNRDFVSLQPPLSFYSLAAVFTILGTSLTALRTFGLCLYTIIPLLLYAIARQRAGRSVALAAAVPAAVLGMPSFHFVPFAVWHGVVAALTAVLLMIRAAVTGRRLWAILAGLATAGTILSRHDQGFYLILAVLAYGFALRFARDEAIPRPSEMLATWAVATAAPLLVLGIWWLASGAVPDMFQQLVVFPVTTYAKTSSLPMPVFRSGLSVTEFLLVAMYYIPPITAVLAGLGIVKVLVTRRFTSKHAHFTFLLVLSVLFYGQVLTRSDLYHLLITLDPFFVVVAWSIAALAKNVEGAIAKWRPGTRLARAAPATLFVGTVLGTGVFLVNADAFLHPPQESLVTLDLPRGGVLLEPDFALNLEKVVRSTQTHAEPDRPILSLPYCPMLYFLAERRNPTRWNYLWPGDQSAQDHQALIAQAKADPPGAIILMREKDMEHYAGAIVKYVKSRYQPTDDFGGLRLYLPAGPKTPGR